MSTAEEPSDVVVVGAGMTGTVTATAAAEAGCRVALLDAAADSTAGGNTSLSGGALHLARSRYDADSEILRDKILGRAVLPRKELVDVVADTAGAGLAWMIKQGVQFEPVVPGDLEMIMAPMRNLADVHDWRDKGPQVALRCLQGKLRAYGGQVIPGTRAVSLLHGPDGRIAGVASEDGRQLKAHAVMLADGGFQANMELRRRFISPLADRMFLRGAPNSMGDGLLMAESAGAKLMNTRWFYGHVLHRDVFHNDRLWPWPGLDELMMHGPILVDPHGRRFVDEGRRGASIVVNAIAQSEDPRGATLIMDEQMWQDSAGEWVWGHRAANPELVQRGGQLIRAQSISELAAKSGIDPQGLAETLDFFATAAAAGQAGNLPIPRTGESVRPLKGPWVAIPAVAGISHTMGGAMIDAHAHVLDQQDRVIPGLYAAGPGTAGPTVGYHGGFSVSITLGLRAARTIAAEGRVKKESHAS
jgi:fumarate reductase flavoprotein subunit